MLRATITKRMNIPMETNHRQGHRSGAQQNECSTIVDGIDTIHISICLGPRKALPQLKCQPGLQFRLFSTRSGLPWLMIRANAPKLLGYGNFRPCSQGDLEAVVRIIEAEVRKQIPWLNRNAVLQGHISRIDLAFQSTAPATTQDLDKLEQSIAFESMQPALRYKSGVYTHNFRGRRPSAVSGVAYLKPHPQTQSDHLRLETRFRRSALRYRFQRSATLNQLPAIVQCLKGEATTFWSERLRWCRSAPPQLVNPSSDTQMCLEELLTSFLEVGLEAFGASALHTPSDLKWLKRFLKNRDAGLILPGCYCSPTLADVRDELDCATNALKMRKSNSMTESRSTGRGESRRGDLFAMDRERSRALLLSLLLLRNGGGALGPNLNLNFGGPCRARTYDPLIKSQLLCQLS